MAINSTSAHLSWLPPDEDQHNGDIRHYNIRIVALHSGREFQLNSTNDTTIYTGLHPAYTYSFTVAAVTVEIGPYSDPAIAIMPEDGMHTFFVFCFKTLKMLSLITQHFAYLNMATVREVLLCLFSFPTLLYCEQLS